ncbi:hypothetical protein MRB53_039405 [Persea americana]|nr:hypothetical protein MRB53_039405 [Persea americana]
MPTRLFTRSSSAISPLAVDGDDLLTLPRLTRQRSPKAAQPTSTITELRQAANMDHKKRPGLGMHLTGHHHKSDERKATPSPKLRAVQVPANTLDISMESPPNTFYGLPATSTGALFSGQLRLNVIDSDVTITSFTMRFVASITAKRPVATHCPDCAVKVTELNKWTFLKEPRHVKHGAHNYPFSYLMPGHLPATTHGTLADLEYSLEATATQANGDKITVRKPIPVHRAIQPAAEKNSLRIFPPTNLTAHLTMLPIIHPIGSIPIQMRIAGAVEKKDDGTLTRWRLRKFAWRLEETEKMISPACAKHAHKVGGEGRGQAHDDVRVLGSKDFKDGWKTDYDEGTVEMEFAIAPAVSDRPLCDVESPTGLAVTHALVVEMVVSEEWAPQKRPSQVTPTGAARVLRMTFNLVITERSGMGISWDEEQPPMYEDVPESPPLYAKGQVDDLDLNDAGHLDLADMARPSPIVRPAQVHVRGAPSVPVPGAGGHGHGAVAVPVPGAGAHGAVAVPVPGAGNNGVTAEDEDGDIDTEHITDLPPSYRSRVDLSALAASSFASGPSRR